MARLRLSSASSREPSSSVGRPNAAGRGRLVEVVGRERPGVHDELDELRHGRAVALPLVGVDDVGLHPLGDVGVLEQGHQRRLVRDERAHVVGVLDDPPQRERAATAGAEGVDGTEAPWRRRSGAGPARAAARSPGRPGQPAALGAPRVVGDDRAVVEVLDELGEARRRHRRPEDEQRPVRLGVAGCRTSYASTAPGTSSVRVVGSDISAPSSSLYGTDRAGRRDSSLRRAGAQPLRPVLATFSTK
jgi:hypothetical protein